MQGFNRVTVCAHVAKDVELETTPGGKSVAKLSLATSNYKKKDSDAPEVSTWFRCTIWGDSAERAASMLIKGMAVYVSGNLEARDWTTKDGEARTSLEVMVTDWRILERKSEKSEKAAAATAAVDSDEAPF